MRLSMIRACVVAAASALALAACSGNGIVPSSQSPQSAPNTQAAPDTNVSNSALPDSSASDSTATDSTTQDATLSPLALTTCAKSPPQYEWILKGACTKITLVPKGTSFTLQQYQNISVKGSIGLNDLKTSATVYLADAIDKNGDILTYKGKAFPAYKGRGTTFLYAAAVNQSKRIIKPKASKKPVLQYIITDLKGLPGKTCSEAVLTNSRGKLVWKPLPINAPVKGKTVTLTQYQVPQGFELPPKIPLYFAANCF